MPNRKFVTWILLASVFALALPKPQVSEAKNAPPAKVLSAGQQASILANLPPFPEDKNRPETDFSKIDWESEVSLPRDAEDYRNKAEELFRQGKAKDIATLQRPVRRMGDSEVMAAYNIPAEVQSLVFEYKKNKENSQAQLGLATTEVGLAGELKAKIKSWQDSLSAPLRTNTNLLDKESSPQEIDISKTPKPNIKSLIPVKLAQAEARLENSSSENSLAKNFTLSPAVNSGIGNFNAAPAQLVGAPKIVEYYTGIEKNPVDYVLYQLSSMQNPDGSFGSFNQYQTTAQIAQQLSNFSRTSGARYAAMTQYLINAAPKDNREKAIKARVMKGLGQPYQTLINELLAGKNTDNAYGIKPGFESDVETTLEVMKAFFVAGTPVDFTFVQGKITPQGTMAYFKNGAPSLSLINKTAVDLQPFAGIPGLASQIGTMLNYLVSRYDAESKTIPGADLTDELRTLQSLQVYSKNPSLQAQWQAKLTGSFSLTVTESSLQTALAALGALAQPDLAITSITTTTANLVNRSAASFTVKVKNNGSAPAVSFKLYDFFDGAQLNPPGYAFDAVITPQQEINIELSYADTVAFVGSTSFKFYIEPGADLNFADNWKTANFNFASAPSGVPAMPLYFIANKHSFNGVPAINVRWSQKSDPNRLDYVIMTRKIGTSNWDFAYLDNSMNGAFAYGLYEEGATYEVTVGALNISGTSIYYYTTPTQVKVSSNDQLYLGGGEGTVTVDKDPAQNIRVFYYGYISSLSQGKLDMISIPNGTVAAWVEQTEYEKIITKFTVPINSTTTGVRLFTTLKNDAESPTISNLYLNPFGNNQLKNQVTLTMSVSGSDNVGWKEVDFYYYSPAQSTWVYIGTASAPGGNQAFMYWYVPASLLGPGYKIKAIAWDFQGNPSLPKESPEFTVTDGTLPTGTITVQGLTNNKWALGETKTISWDINSPSGITSLQSISVQAGGQNNNLANNYNAANHSITFTMPLYATYVNSAAYIRISLYDNNGNYGVIESAPFEITDPSPLPHAPWGSPQQLSPFTVTYPLERTLQAVYPKTDGSLEVVYRELDGLPYGEPGQYVRLVYRKFTGTDWLSPVVIKEYLYLYGQTLPTAFSDVVTAQGSNGDIYIAYGQGFGDGLAGFDSADVYFARISAGLLATTRQISADNTAATGIKIASSSQNKVYITWNEGRSFVNQTGTATLRYVEGDGANTWTSMAQLLSEGSDRSALTSEGASPVVVFAQNSQFYFIKKSGSSWTAPIVINKPGIAKNELDVFTEDAAKLSLLVEPDLSDPSQYKWLNTVKTQAQLTGVLSANNFVNAAGILSAWQKNEYPNNYTATALFANGGNSYDLFFRGAMDTITYLYNVRHVGFSINTSSNQSEGVKDSWIIDKEPSQDVRGYHVVRSANGLYHLLYVKWDYADNYRSTVYHTIFDGQSTYFTSLLGSRYMTVSEYPVMLSENNNVVSAYFSGGLEGSLKQLVNIGDFGAIVNFRLNQTAPANAGTLHSSFADLKWTLNGSADYYNVFFGLDRFALSPVAQNVTGNQTRVKNLIPNKTYYWQVEAKNAGQSIYSNISRFNSAEVLDTTAPLVFITSPVNGATVLSTVSVTASSTDDEGVAGVQFKLDGQNLGAEITAATPPNSYSVSWNTASTTNGSHTLTAVARDIFNNTSTSTAVTINVANAGLPGAPTAVSATAGTGQAVVSFTPPASNGGSAITGYTVTSNPGGITATGTTSPITISGLTNGTPYNFTVKAVNAIGASLPSNSSNTVTPLLPFAPNITSQFTVVKSVVVLNRLTGRYQQTVTITNNGAAVDSAAYAVDGLPAGVSVYLPSGQTSSTVPASMPYKELGAIGAAAKITLNLEFTRIGTPAVTYTARVLGSGGPR